MNVESPKSDSVIRLEKVHKAYGPVTIIHSLDLDIHRGEFLTLLGPSGCGKTTTLKMIAGFEQPTSGRILLDGVDVSRTRFRTSQTATYCTSLRWRKSRWSFDPWLPSPIPASTMRSLAGGVSTSPSAADVIT